MSAERTNYVDHHVIDEEQNTIGTVTDVLYDDNENEPKWLVVKPGPLQAERFVPIERSYETDEGNIVIPFDRKWVKHAPKAKDHVLSPEVEADAKNHYETGST